MKNIFVTLIVALGLSGCAYNTTPVSVFKADAGKVTPEFAQASPEKVGRLVLTRDTGWNRSACPMRVFLNDVKAAELSVSDSVSINLLPAQYKMTVRFGGVCESKKHSVLLNVYEKNPTFIEVGLNRQDQIEIRWNKYGD